MKFANRSTASKILKSARGFSLIELMVVVAIIGILASIAIPNFQRMRLKAKQSEAKQLLSYYYTSQKAFQNEYNFYFGNMVDIGFLPDGALNYEIQGAGGGRTLPSSYSFSSANSAGAGGTDGTMLTTTALCVAGVTESNCTVETAYAAAAATVTPANTGSTFLATAGSNIDGDATLDEWSIDEGKTVTNNQNDVDL